MKIDEYQRYRQKALSRQHWRLYVFSKRVNSDVQPADVNAYETDQELAILYIYIVYRTIKAQASYNSSASSGHGF